MWFMEEVSLEEIMSDKSVRYEHLNYLMSYLGSDVQMVLQTDLELDEVKRFAYFVRYALFRDLEAFGGNARYQDNVYYQSSEEMNDYGR